jgi:hypothetical protein
MKAHILTGSKSEIAEQVARIDGTIHEVIVFVEEPTPSISEETVEAMFAEMEPYTVKVGGADYSRESIYTRMEGE